MTSGRAPVSFAGLRKVAALAIAGIVFVYAAAYADLVLRARSAYLEGEKYMQWNEQPALKKAYFDKQLAERLTQLQAAKAAGQMTALEYEERIKLAQVEHDDRLAESSLKYAYQWFKTSAELFSPPESKWVRLSRTRMAEAKTLWKQELDAAKIPYEDYMLE